MKCPTQGIRGDSGKLSALGGASNLFVKKHIRQRFSWDILTIETMQPDYSSMCESCPREDTVMHVYCQPETACDKF